MTESLSKQSRIQFLYTDIGRGHPFYLDGIIEALEALDDPSPLTEASTVFESSHGLALSAWNTARWLYRKGSSGGMIGRVYAGLRNGSDYNRPGPGLRLLGRDIKKKYKDGRRPLVVAHPTLLGILRGRSGLIYQHGEVAVPPESVVRGAETVLAPTEEAARKFVEAGYSMEQVPVTGLCIEPGLCDLAESCYQQRKLRLSSDKSLTGLYVSSEAEPKQHVTSIIASIASCVKAGGNAVILARQGGRLHLAVAECMTGCPQSQLYCRTVEEAENTRAATFMALYDSRQSQLELTAALFERADFLVAPAHERTGWALGLGLPMFVLTPSIGPFAPLNLKALTEAGVALPLDEANPPESLAELVAGMREDGSLLEMARAGWGRRNIDGFANIARFLVSKYGGR